MRPKRATPPVPAGPPVPPIPEALEALELGDGRVIFAHPLPKANLPATLTPAEREVVLLALDGHGNAAIANERGCSARTAANLLARACRKLGVRSRGELAAAVCGRSQ
jgi:DNA-binding CsgD family transcriptional regulator